MASCGLPLAALMEGGDPRSGPLGPTRRTGSAHVGLPAHVVQLFGLPWRQAHTFPFTADPWPVLRGWPPGKDTRVQGQRWWAPSQTSWIADVSLFSSLLMTSCTVFEGAVSGRHHATPCDLTSEAGREAARSPVLVHLSRSLFCDQFI